MIQPHTRYRHRCRICGEDFISEFQVYPSAVHYDHDCPVLNAMAQHEVDAARVDASNEDAQRAIDEFYAMLRPTVNNEH